MTAEELRQLYISDANDALGRWAVRGGLRQRIGGLLAYFAIIKTEELETILTLMPKGDTMHGNHVSCCARALGKLAEALEAIHEHECACESDPAAAKCCQDSAALVLQAMELEIGCLKTCA